MKKSQKLKRVAGGIAALSAVFAIPFASTAHAAVQSNSGTAVSNGKDSTPTTTPIKHVVVIFGENVSFDHYFGTYPNATNPPGEPAFHAAPNTPKVKNYTSNAGLLTNNPNGVNPQRLDRSEAMTADMDHGYTAEQQAFDGGKMDKFVQDTGHGNDIVMDYYDGNTVTALWNYAQHFAMSDNSYGTTFGPSTPGAVNLISGQTHGATAYRGNVVTNPNALPITAGENGNILPGKLDSNGTLFSDADPYLDKASSGNTIEMTGKNVGDLLNAKGVTWGWFEGGFANPSAQHTNVGGANVTDYSPHHEPFQYYASTANPYHLPPSSVSMIGMTDQANHQYDMSNFWTAVNNGNMPAVSFLKAPMYQDGHAGYSDPLDEQTFIVNTINALEKSPDWKNTAVIINYDDSDGWYDPATATRIQSGSVINGSTDTTPLSSTNSAAVDELFGAGNAGTVTLSNYQDRAGYGPRLPLLIISPYAKQNYVDNTLTDQSSILKFIEDNWNLGRIGNGSYDAVAGSLEGMFDFSHGRRSSKLFLNPTTGEPADSNGSNNNQGKDKGNE